MNMSKRKRLFVVYLFVSIISLSVLSLGLSAANTKKLPENAAPQSEQVLRIPLQYTGSYMDIMKTMYNRVGRPEIIQESLVRFDKNYDLHPGAAKEWEVSEDGLTWTFHLYEDLKWSDGKPLTAEDYVFALERILKKGYDFAWYYSFAAGIKNWKKVQSGDLPLDKVGVRAVDDHTIEVTTEEPKPYLPSVFSWWFPVPEHIVELYGDEYATKDETLVCSGPFKVTNWEKGEKIVYTANPEYHGNWKPYIQSIVEVAGTTDPKTAFPAYLSGELDWSKLNTGQLAFVNNNIPDQLVTFPFFEIVYLALNTYSEPLDDPKVRKAMAMAIDRELLTNTVLKGFRVPTTTVIMPGFPGYNEENKDILAYDPEKAQRLLAEAGYPDGKDFPTITLYLHSKLEYMEVAKDGAEFVQNQLKKNLGIDINIRIIELETWMEGYTKREKDFFYSGYVMDYFDPSNFMNLWGKGGREPWNNQEYNKLVNKANSLYKWEERKELYKKAEEILLNDAPAIPLTMVQQNQVWKPYLKGEAVEPNENGVKRAGGQLVAYWYTHIYIGEGK